MYDLGEHREQHIRAQGLRPIFTDAASPEECEAIANDLASYVQNHPKDINPPGLVRGIFESLAIMNSPLDLYEAPFVLKEGVERAQISRLGDVESSLRVAITIFERLHDSDEDKMRVYFDELEKELSEYPEITGSSLMQTTELLYEKLPAEPMVLQARQLMLLVLDYLFDEED